MDQEAYTNRFMHLILDHLSAWEGEDYLSSFMNNCHLEGRAQHKTQKAIKAFIEEFLDDVVQVIHSPGESAGQYSIRMRTVNEDKQGSNSGKSDSEEEKRPSKSRRRGRRSGSRSPKQPEHGVKVHVGNLNYDTQGWQIREVLGASFYVKECQVIYPYPGAERSRGWAIVEFWSGADAKQAIEWYHDWMLDGRMMAMREFRD